MRKNVILYIGDTRADLDENALILFNYTMDDLTNPAVVKNSYSQQITLKGTDVNNGIFSHFYQNDFRTAGGFNSMLRTPFFIRNAEGEVLESGYLKLDSVSRSKGEIVYKCTLYGGLGSFLYELSFTNAGEKMTLADIPTWYVGSSSVNFASFGMTKSVVKEGWNWLISGTTPSSHPWLKVVNFAPCYNGIPDAEYFNPDKVLVDLNTVPLGIANSVVEEGITYNAHNGFVMANLDSEYTEAEIRDYRSYLQRPVLKIEHFFDTLKQFSSYTINLDADFFNNTNAYYKSAWMTLPTFQDTLTGNLGAQSWSGTGNNHSEGETPWGWNPSCGVFNVSAATGGGNKTVWSNPTVDLWFKINSSTYGCQIVDGYFGLLFMTYHNVDSTEIGHSILYVLYSVNEPAAVDIDNALRLKGYRLNDFDVIMSKGAFASNGLWHGTNTGNINTRFAAEILPTYGLNSVKLMSYLPDQLVYQGTSVSLTQCDGYISGGWIAKDAASRTGCTITRERIFQGTQSPADYLLSYCKMFHLQIVVDNMAKTVNIMPMTKWYDNTTVDISERIDLSKGMDINPVYADARWFVLSQEVEGEKAEVYQNTWGRPYGRMRIDTNYPFNAEETELLEGMVLKGAVQVQGRSMKMVYPVDKSTRKRSWQQTAHTLVYGIPGASVEVDQQGFTPASYIAYGDTAFYDKYDKPQFCDASGKKTDGANCLLFLQNGQNENVWLTDDTAEMIYQNASNSCWIITEDTTIADYVAAPRFSRFLATSGSAGKIMEFGVPMEIYTNLYAANPPIPASSSVYYQYWKNYITDRYDKDSRVCTVRCDLRGLGEKVSANLMRHFYWFDGCVWVLNKIKNYSLTTEDFPECEFIKVKDKTNYTS